jgi:hypothetical protein
LCRLVVLALLASGCGLADYEARMVAEQKRLEYLDLENAYLGEPITPPPKPPSPPAESEPANPAPSNQPEMDLFLRLPKGVATKYKSMPLGSVLYQYVGNSAPISDRGVPVAEAAGCNFQDIYVATSRTLSLGEFWEAILQPFGVGDRSSLKPVTLDAPPDRPKALTYETLSFTQPGEKPLSYYIYVYPGDQGKVGIVYVVTPDKTGSSDMIKAKDLSLKSLVIGADATAVRATYRSRQPPKSS